jgi:hypothetical protein
MYYSFYDKFLLCLSNFIHWRMRQDPDCGGQVWMLVDMMPFVHHFFYIAVQKKKEMLLKSHKMLG